MKIETVTKEGALVLLTLDDCLMISAATSELRNSMTENEIETITTYSKNDYDKLHDEFKKLYRNIGDSK